MIGKIAVYLRAMYHVRAENPVVAVVLTDEAFVELVSYMDSISTYKDKTSGWYYVDGVRIIAASDVDRDAITNDIIATYNFALAEFAAAVKEKLWKRSRR